MERQDLDALLIGALYGELTPAEESRLAAHLESHPADRGALDDLKSARQKIQDSRIFAVQVEPPQAISAVLLQEAHRRAPKRVAAGTESEKESWFARFAKNFMSHPAMAAAAMLVLVLGGAGILWMKKGDQQYATKEVASSQTAPTIAQGSAAWETTANGDIPAAAPPAGDDLARQLDGQAAAGSGYAAQLYENEEGGAKAGEVANAESQRGGDANVRTRQQAAATDTTAIPVGAVERAPKDFEKDKADAYEQRADRAAAQKKQVAPKGAAKNAPGEAFDPEASFDDSSLSTNAVSGAGRVGNGTAHEGYAQPPPSATGSTAGPAPATGTTFGVGGAGGAATTTPARKAPAPAAAAEPAPANNAPAKETAKKTSGAPSSDTRAKQTPSPPPPPRDAPKLEAAPSAPAPVQPTSEAKPEPPRPEPKVEAKVEQKRDESSTLVSWAKSEHARAVALAKSSDCTGAAKVALSVSNRAPSYYSQYMATDRALKSCAQYINAERERDVAAKKAAQQRATDTK